MTTTSSARSSLSRAAAILATVAASPSRPLDHLETIHSVRWMLDHAEGAFADAAYRENATFAEIGRARGTTRQTEREHWLKRQQTRDVDPFDRWLKMMRDNEKARAVNIRRRTA